MYVCKLAHVLEKINKMELDLSKIESYTVIINYWNINVDKQYQFFYELNKCRIEVEFIKHLVSISLQHTKFRLFCKELHILTDGIISGNTDLTDITISNDTDGIDLTDLPSIMKRYNDDINNILWDNLALTVPAWPYERIIITISAVILPLFFFLG